MKPNEPPARTPIAYGYGRVSTDKQADSGLSADSQKAAHERHWRLRLEHEGVLYGGTFIDGEKAKGKGVSGKTRFIERKAGRELWGRLVPGDHVIFTRLDRGFRSFADAVWTLEEWIKKGVHVHIVTMGIDTSTEGGKLMMRVFAAVAEFERSIAVERTREALRHRKKRGGVMNQYAGYGRRLEGQKGHRRVAEDPAELKVMAAIADMIDVRGYTLDQVYLAMLKANLRTRENKAWSRPRIYRAYKRLKNLPASCALTPATTPGQPSPTASPTS